MSISIIGSDHKGELSEINILSLKIIKISDLNMFYSYFQLTINP